MEDSKIKEIMERVEIATPGRYSDNGYRIHYPNGDLCFEYKHNNQFHYKDAELFCNAREDIKELLEEVKRLSGLLGLDFPELVEKKDKDWGYLCFRDRMAVEIRKEGATRNFYLQSNGEWVGSSMLSKEEIKEIIFPDFESIIWKEDEENG